MSKELIIQKVYDLLKNAIPLLNKFPRSQKFTLADRIQNQLSDLLELYIEAYYLSSNKKLPLVQKSNILLEKLRHFFRLAYDLGLISFNAYSRFAEQLNEIGRMTGGWIKALKKIDPPTAE